jgi:hypothetical protein
LSDADLSTNDRWKFTYDMSEEEEEEEQLAEEEEGQAEDQGEEKE